MAVIFSDKEISGLLRERKPLSGNWRLRASLRPKRGHDESDLDIAGERGNAFRLILRQNTVDRFDFSVILAVRAPASSQPFRIRRHNGKSHEHTNHIEGDTFYDYHIHMATERYQIVGAREDAYAEVTDRYTDLQGALECMFEDACFEVPPNWQPSLL